EGLGKNFRDTPWVQPRKELALQHGKASIFESGKASIFGTGPKQLGGLGEGISLYFYILKFLSIYFFVASVLAVPHMLLSFSGEALDEQVVGQTSPLIKFTAINHADPVLIEAESEPSGPTAEASTALEVKYCKSTSYNLNIYTCEELQILGENNDFTVPVRDTTSPTGAWDGSSERLVTITLAMLDCDLGCGCDFDLSRQVGSPSASLPGSSSTIETCPDYYRASEPSTDLESSTCAISGSSPCGDVSCADVMLMQGSAAFASAGAKDTCGACCIPSMTCGEYNPSRENLNLAPFYNATVTRDDASLLISLCDIIYCILFVLLWKYMSRKVAVVVRQTDDDNVTAGDYTVSISGLPPSATEEQVRKHFSDIYQLSEPDWTFPGYLCGLLGKKKARLPEECVNYDQSPLEDLEPVRDISCHGKQNYVGSWVADVNIAHPNGKLIRRCQALKKYSNKLLEARAQLLEEKIAKIHKSLQSSAASFTRIDKECMYAFVTFENEDSYIRCIEDYGRYSTRSLIRPWTWFVPPQPPILKFQGQHHLTVDESPEPSNIMWENLETTYFSGLARKAITATVTIITLVISLALVILVKAVKEDVEAAVPDLSKCTTGLPAVFSMDSSSVDYIWYSDFDGLCGEGNFITVDGFFSDLTEETDESIVEGYIRDMAGTCVDPCVAASTDKVTCIGYNGQEIQDDTVFDRLRSFSAYQTGSGMGGEGSGRLLGKPLYFDFDDCPGYDYQECPEIVTYVARIKADNPTLVEADGDIEYKFDDTSVLACVEDLDPSWLPSSGTVQKSCVQVQKQTMKGCFCLTAMIDSIELYGVLDGAQKLYEDFSDVCGDFAKQYLLAQTLVIGSAAMVTVINVLLKPIKLCMAGVSATQRSLNKKVEGPEFEISTRFPMILNTLAVTMVFSSALPILLPIAFVACQLFYHVDKLLLLRYFRKPPAYDAKLASGTVHLLPFVLLVHCAFATWVYGAPQVFQSTCIPLESFDYEEYLATAGEYDTMNMLPRILRRNVFPMFLLTILLTTLIIYEYFGSWIVSKLLKGTIGNALKVVFAPFKKLWECCCAKALLVDKEYNPPFTKDFVRGYPKGEHPPSLSQKAGWELTKDDEGYSVHRKMWTDTGEIVGRRHTEGEMKKTWEAIRDTQVHTYNIRNNPKYTDAMIAKDELINALNMNTEAEFEEEAAPAAGNKVVPVS
ncbi:hypothetical protein TrRE_jg6856, partial [Triparma retinervis]